MVIAVPYAVDLLTAVGFVYAEMDGGKYLMFSENEHNIATANLFCSTMEEEMRKLEAPLFAVGIHSSPSGTTVKEISSSSTGTDNKKKKSNNDSLEQERKTRVLNAKKIKLAKNVEKNRVIQLLAEDKEERQKRSSKNIKIRKLDETASPSTKKPLSLEYLRAKAAETWNTKQKSNNNDNDSTMNENNGNDKDNDESVVTKSDNPVGNDTANGNCSIDMEEDDASDLKPAAATSVLESLTDTETMRHPSTSVENNNISTETDLLHRRMKEAAQCDNFILAGQIQKEIQESESFDQKVVDLNAQIKEAALNGDYVTAGRLQATLKAHQGKVATVASGSTSNLLSSSAQQQMYPQDDEEMESVDDQFSDEEDSFENGYGNPKLNKWGSGQKLNQITSPISASKDTPATVSVIRLPVKDSRRLRIRLPTSSIVEEFDSNETLKTVYQVVKIHLDQAKVDTNQRSIQAKVVQLRGLSDELGNQKVGLSGGAFAVPLSEFGFTLLSAIPKREFSLEIDGLKSLKDLNMAKSAALTVMQCNQRGLARRGTLEDKLAEAQGDAMDVDDLNYEALQELGEKMGVGT